MKALAQSSQTRCAQSVTPRRKRALAEADAPGVPRHLSALRQERKALAEAQAQKLQAGKTDYSWHFGPLAWKRIKRNSPTRRSDMRKGADRSRRPLPGPDRWPGSVLIDSEVPLCLSRLRESHSSRTALALSSSREIKSSSSMLPSLNAGTFEHGRPQIIVIEAKLDGLQ